MTETMLAQNVCHVCMLRKKACDKALPACGFCASRRLRCKYDVSAPKRKSWQAYNPGRHFVPLQFPSPPSVSPPLKAMIQQLPFTASQPDYAPFLHSSLYVLPQSVEESLKQLAQHLSELAKLTYDSIIDPFFRSFHQWLPVVSPDSFRHEASRYRREGQLPPACFTVLILTMLLIVLPTLDPSSRPSRASQEFFYRTTKSAISRAQASMCMSLRLVQAAFLIALREYTSARPEAAYISMMTCAGLARLLGVEITSVSSMKGAQQTSDSRLEMMERENLAWAIAMLERLISCEMDQRDLRPQTEYPGPDCRLPSDLKSISGLDSTSKPNLQALDQVTLSKVDSADAGQFGQQAQTVSLLDRLLFVMRLTASNNETKLAGLAELDSKIRSLLEVVMTELQGRQTLICVPVALCVRLLFLLHGSVLDILPYPQSETDHQRRTMSCIGLDTACRMMLDVGQRHGEEKAPIMPICCFYNLRAARELMQERKEGVVDGALSCDIDCLLGAEEEYRNTWVI